MSNSTQLASITDADVADYLSEHPDFFDKHLDLLHILDIPHQSGDAVSLIERQLQVLRQSNRDAKSRFNKVLNVAKINEQHFENTKGVTLELIDFLLNKSDFETLFKLFEKRFPTYLAADEFRFIIFDFSESARQAFSHARIKHVESVRFSRDFQNLGKLQKTLCGNLLKEDRAFLFDERAEKVASCAVVPLKHKQFSALLAIGNHDAEHFHKGLGTLFLDHIAEIVSRVCSVVLVENKGENLRP